MKSDGTVIRHHAEFCVYLEPRHSQLVDLQVGTSNRFCRDGTEIAALIRTIQLVLFLETDAVVVEVRPVNDEQ
jgi:hypothetical protein